MAILVSGGQTETVHLDETGDLTSDLNVNVGLPSVVNELAANGLSMSELESSLGGGFAYGTGPIGFDGAVTYTPGTDEFSLSVNVAYAFLGGDIAVNGTYNPETGYIHVDQVEGFAGANFILGQQGELLGITIGNVGSIQAGIFFQSTPVAGTSAFPGARISYSHGLVLGSVEGVSTWNASNTISDVSDLTVETATEIFDAFYQSPLNSMSTTEEMFHRIMFPIVNLLDPLDRSAALSSFLERMGVSECFLAGTQIDMWPTDPGLVADGSGRFDRAAVLAGVWQKPIEQIVPGDRVLSFGASDDLRPGRVSRTFTNDAMIVLDFFGTGVTPGHVYLRADATGRRRFETLIDILRDDGAIMLRDGTVLRAATGVPLDDPRDGLVQAVAGPLRADGQGIDVRDRGWLRLGTRAITGDGRDICIADLIDAAGGQVTASGLIRIGDQEWPFHWAFGDTLPRPEDYVLRRSATTLADIYRAAEWEAQRPTTPPPMQRDGGPVQPLSALGRQAMPRNDPPGLHGRSRHRGAR